MIYRTEISSEKYRAKEHFKRLIDSDQVIEIKNVGKKRSLLINRSVHLWFEFIAEALNDSGQYIPIKGYKEGAYVNWTKEAVKERLWRPAQVLMFNKNSSAELTDNEMCEIIEGVIRILGEVFNLTVEFPNRDYNAKY